MEVKTYLEKLSQKFGVPIGELEKLYLDRKRNAMEAYEYSEEEASKFAVDSIIGDFRKRILEKTEDFLCIVTGTDGRITDWAKIARKKVSTKIEQLRKEGKTEQDLINLGLLDEEGNLLYPKEDRFRGGKVIPESDITTVVEGIVVKFGDKTKLIPAILSSKTANLLEMVGEKKIYKVSGKKSPKSTEDVLYISVDNGSFVPQRDIEYKDYVEACEFLYSKYSVGMDQLVALSENLPQDSSKRRVTLKDVQIIGVRKDIGERRSIMAVGQIPVALDKIDSIGTEKYGTITIWIPKEIKFVPYQYQVISVSGMVSAPNPERGSLVINATAAWCDERFLHEKPIFPTQDEDDEEEEDMPSF